MGTLEGLELLAPTPEPPVCEQSQPASREPDWHSQPALLGYITAVICSFGGLLALIRRGARGRWAHAEFLLDDVKPPSSPGWLKLLVTCRPAEARNSIQHSVTQLSFAVRAGVAERELDTFSVFYALDIFRRRLRKLRRFLV